MNADELRRRAITAWWKRRSLDEFIARLRAAQGIEARQGGDVKQAPREAREPGPKDAPKGTSHA
jgi:hypothetical protein